MRLLRLLRKARLLDQQKRMLPLPLDPLRAVVVEGQLLFLTHNLWLCGLLSHHLAVFLRGHPLGNLLLWLLLADDLLERLLLHLGVAF